MLKDVEDPLLVAVVEQLLAAFGPVDLVNAGTNYATFTIDKTRIFLCLGDTPNQLLVRTFHVEFSQFEISDPTLIDKLVDYCKLAPQLDLASQSELDELSID